MDPLLKVKRELEESRETLRDAISCGSASDFATYRQLVGRMETLDMVISYITEVEQQYIES